MIEIHQPAIEALIHQRLTAGGFDNIEEVLLQALRDAPLPDKAAVPNPAGPSGHEILAAFQCSPHKETNLFPESHVLPISDPVEF